MTGGSEMDDSSGTTVVREISGTSWPTLTRINYGEWSMTMKVKLRAQ